MDDMVLGALSAKFSVDGSRVLRYYVDFTHRVLDVHKTVSAPPTTDQTPTSSLLVIL